MASVVAVSSAPLQSCSEPTWLQEAWQRATKITLFGSERMAERLTLTLFVRIGLRPSKQGTLLRTPSRERIRTNRNDSRLRIAARLKSPEEKGSFTGLVHGWHYPICPVSCC